MPKAAPVIFFINKDFIDFGVTIKYGGGTGIANIPDKTIGITYFDILDNGRRKKDIPYTEWIYDNDFFKLFLHP